MRLVLTTVLLLLGVLRTTASAVSVDQIVRLSQAGVSDEVLLALIDRDKSVFAIEPEELPALKRAGVSQAVVLAMLRSGRQPPVVAPESIEPLRMIGPDITIVGHGPEIPNAAAENYVTFAPPVWNGGLAVIGPRPCASAAAISNRYILIGPPTVGRFVPDPAAAPRSGAATINCHSMAAQGRLRSRR